MEFLSASPLKPGQSSWTQPRSSATLPALAVLLLACILMSPGCRKGTDVATNENDPPSEANSPSDAAQDDGEDKPVTRNWPSFRGSPNALGRAEGSLPEVLQLDWEYQLEEGGFIGAPVVFENRVYLAGMNGKVLALDFASGEEVWQVDLDTFIDASPAIIDDRMIFGDLDGTLYCLDIADGDVKWSKPLETSFISSVNEYEGDIIAIGETGLLVRLDLQTGDEVWRLMIEDQILSSPSISLGHCFLTGCASVLYSIDVVDPEIESKRPLAAPTGVTAAIDGEFAYISVSGGSIYCIDWKAGEEVWEYYDPMGDQEGVSCPALHEDYLVIGGGSSRNVICLDRKTGNRHWVFSTRRMVNASPVVIGNDVVFGGHDNRVYVIDIESGDPRFEYECGGVFAASPAVVDGKFIVATNRGGVFCFGAGMGPRQ